MDSKMVCRCLKSIKFNIMFTAIYIHQLLHNKQRGCQMNNKIGRQKSVVCHAKIARFCQPTKSPDFVGQDRACLSSTILLADFSYIGQQILFMLPW